jgi:hypothetical protein
MPSTMPVRVGDDLFASAKLAAEATGRSAVQQIGYWAKLGRELERSGTVSVREIAEVLAGAGSYDDLDPKAQAIVRAEWDARIEARRAGLNLAEVFAAEGRSWVEMGPEGTTIRRPATDEPIAKTQKGGKRRTGRLADPKPGTAETKPSDKAAARTPGANKAIVKKAPTQKKTARAR